MSQGFMSEKGGTRISHDRIADVSADDHHAEAHTVASHSDTTATGAELETLTDGSDADSLHGHGSAIHDDVTGEIAAITAKTTPVDADVTLIEDSAASNAKKRLSWANIKATLKTYFDTLYAAVADGVTNGDSHDHSGGDGAQIDHAGLANLTTGDPHTQYQQESEKSSANGYASLDASTLVPTDELGTGTADSTTFLRGDQSWATPSATAEVSFRRAFLLGGM